jgi:signal transduction histidine kinase
MTAQQLNILAFGIESALYLLILLLVVVRSRLQDLQARALFLFVTVSGLWALEQLVWHLGWLNALDLGPYLKVRLPLYGLVLLALLLLNLTRAVLRQPEGGHLWTVITGVWIAGLAILDSAIFASQLSTLTFVAAIVGWGILAGASLLLTLRVHRETKLPLHRSRHTYWLLVWAILVAGDLLFLAGQAIMGSTIHLIGCTMAAYTVMTHALTDAGLVLRRTISYLIVTFLTVALYTVSFAVAQIFFWDAPGYTGLWTGAIVALVLAILFGPLLRRVRGFVGRLLGGTGTNPSRLVSEYSARISHIVSLERLATVAIDLMQDTMGFDRGLLYVVNHEADEPWTGLYHLQGVATSSNQVPPPGTLSEQSPLTQHLRAVRQPLTQYDLDLLPEFQSMPEPEKQWLSALGMDIYVPIHSQASWIGLFAFGLGSSAARTSKEDLALLSVLADQTAVALENARLVDDLIELNYDLERAYTRLDRANRQLQEMDRLKSAFIGAITHELRSPFANIDFSLQIFTRDGLETLTEEQRQQLQLLTANTKLAQAMVDNLVAFTTFLSKQGTLNLDEVDFGQALSDTLSTFQPMMDAKGLVLRTAVSDELPLLRGDRERLSDAVCHLVHNAIKFTPQGGEIWLRSHAKDQQLLFEIKDTGVGIPADKVPSLWEGFAQVADPLQRGIEGLGLGLPLVKYIITAHGGRVWAESREGDGSIFGFQIPLSGPETQPRRARERVVELEDAHKE